MNDRLAAAFRRARAQLGGRARLGRFFRRKHTTVEAETSQLLLDLDCTTPELEPSKVTSVDLRSRLVSLGETFCIEVAPADVCPPDPSKAKTPSLLQLQAQSVAEEQHQPFFQSVAEEKKPFLRKGCHVYINMVKPNMAHFGAVESACSALVSAGFRCVPHVPAARFESVSDFESTLASLARGGAQSVLLVGGNDLGERVSAGSCVFSDGVKSLLQKEVEFLKAQGVVNVSLAGHPDGHSALGFDVDATAAMLLEKAQIVLAAGLQLTVTTQFSFDAHKLIQWLKRTRQDMINLQGAIEKRALQEARTGSKTSLPGAIDDEPLSSPRAGVGRVSFHIGLPGPTPKKKMDRIAKICEVPSQFVPSAFDAVKCEDDGLIGLKELEAAADDLSLSLRGDDLRKLFGKHVGERTALGRQEFALLLVDDALESIPKQVRKAPGPLEAIPAVGPSVFVSSEAQDTLSPLSPTSPWSPPTHAPGPSVFVSNNGSAETTSPSAAAVTPDELIVALAGFCEREKTVAGEVCLHFFPFGGLSKTLELTRKLRDGVWPEVV